MEEKGFVKWIKNNLGWVIGVAFVVLVLSPFIFTREVLFDCFNFSETGAIGDTVGGLTSPVVGFISIILLYITLQEQIKINVRQKKDNDFIVLLNLQSQIQEKNNGLVFRYDSLGQKVDGKGIFELNNLDSNLFEDNFIHSPMFNMVLSNMKLLDVSIRQFLKMNYEVGIDDINKMAFYEFAKIYGNQIVYFYDLCIRNVIDVRRVPAEIDVDDLFSEKHDPLNQQKKDLEEVLKQYRVDLNR